MFKQEIEKIIHPFVKFEVFKRVIYHFFTNKKAVLIEVPLFFELNLDRFFDSILITCDKKKQSDRILGRDGHKNIDNKINAQLDMNFKIKRATYVIYNDGNINTLQKKLENFKVDGNSFLTYLGLIFLIILLSMVINKNM
ncbi:Dephospho-CoA kinase cab5 [Gurleya vavrai]